MAMIEEPSQEIYNYSDIHPFNLSKLAINQYYIVTNNEMQEPIFWERSRDECYNCMPLISRIRQGLSFDWNPRDIDAKYSEKWSFRNITGGHICDLSTDEIGQFGIYEMSFPNCTLETLVEPVDIYLPILTVILIYLLVAAVLVGSVFGYKMLRKRNVNTDVSEVKKNRIKSLDAFRGLSLIVMLLVNYGTGYNFLEHAVWNGLTIADVVFPWFLWIMGVCIPISINSAMKQGKGFVTIMKHILKRSAILFMLGIINNGIGVFIEGGGWAEDRKNIYNLRIFGVLQRLGLCYALAATVCASSMNFFSKNIITENAGVLQDITMMLPQWIYALICVVIHTSITFGLEVPDCPVKGYLGPGGPFTEESSEFSYGSLVNCTGGAVAYVDREILGEKLMYTGGTFIGIYKTSLPVDPEGIIGTFNAVFQVFLGIQAGVTLLMYKSHIGRVARWLIWGAITGIIGGGLCGFTRDEGVIPINKNLWSLTFVLVTSSLAFIVLSILYLLIDGNEKKFWSGKPFIFAGMNPIILYMGQGLTLMRFPFQWGTLEPNLHFQMLSQAVWGTMCWWLVAYWLYKIKFFLTI